MKGCAVKNLKLLAKLHLVLYEIYIFMFLFSIVEPKSLNVEVLNGIDKSQGLQKHHFHSDLAFKHDLSCFAVARDNG